VAFKRGETAEELKRKGPGRKGGVGAFLPGEIEQPAPETLKGRGGAENK